MTQLGLIIGGAAVLLLWSGLTGENPLSILGALVRGEDLPRVADRGTAVDRLAQAAADAAGDNPDNERVDVSGRFTHPLGGAGSVPAQGHFGAPRDGGARRHAGLDLSCPEGTPVLAAHDANVELAGWAGGYGNVVYLTERHELPLGAHAAIQTRYAHLRAGGIAVRQGAQVRRGQLIGYSGNTGNSTGPHLHFEIRLNGTAVDPAPLI